MKRKTTLECYNFTVTKRPKILSKIQYLPTDVMILIFKFLTPSERRSAITVCQQWLDLVNEYFSKDHCLVLTSDLDYSITGSLYRTFSDRLTTSKDKRTFSHLVIESFPYSTGKLSLMGNFIALIEDEVTSLKIGKNSDYPDTVIGTQFKLNLFSKLPKLESLKVSSDLLLADLSSSTSLKSIKVLATSCHVNLLKNCRKLKSLESLTMSGIALKGREMSDESLFSFLEPSTKALLSQIVTLKQDDFITLEAPTFNFCGKAKMTPDDINGIHIEHCDKPLPQKILSQFKNIKRLKFSSRHLTDRPLVLATKRVTYSGITELELNGLLLQPVPHFDNFLQNFPDLESLKIYGFRLKNEHFSIICRFMPKLKELSLRGLWFADFQISIRTVLDGQFALKDLRFLEKLDIETRYFRNSGQWPSLLNLKELSLNGNGFSNFNRDFYLQIAQKCPKLTHVTIDYNNGNRSTFAKFLPLLQQLKLKHLSLPCVGNTFHSEAAYTELIANLIEHCQQLKEVTITDGVGFSLSRELQLFSNIASLIKIISMPTSDEDDYRNRVMKRKDVKNLKGYLFKNLSLYKDLRETIEYVAESVIPPNEFLEMNQSFQSNFANEDGDAEEVAYFYIVIHSYLGMNYFDFCKLTISLADAVDI